MKKAFDANVSRAKPRMRLGALLASESAPEVEPSVAVSAVEAIAEQVLQESLPELSLSGAVKARAGRARPSASQALQEKLKVEARASVVPDVSARVHAVPAPVARAQVAEAPPVSVVKSAVALLADSVESPQAHGEAPATVTEVQTAPPPQVDDFDVDERRERLRERLKAVRENPRPEPLPETVAEAGVLAVERISALQTELTKVRALNLALTHDLDSARRQAERATEEARVRMDEARRLSSEMESRVTLLAELERELGALEAERNEALLALQESRHSLDAHAAEKAKLLADLESKDVEVRECLAEEERLAGELEEAQASMLGLKRSADVLKGERDMLARQVSDLTRERADLLEARKALESVHRALSRAVAR